jgi:toxin ParE1/3/4
VRKLVLTNKAQSDLDAIHEHYASLVGAEYAAALVVRLLDSLQGLRQFTGLGRPSQVPGIRELVMSDLPFIAPYRFVRNEVQVLRLLHQRAERSESG